MKFSSSYAERTAALKAAEKKAVDDFEAETLRASRIQMQAQSARDAAVAEARQAAATAQREREIDVAADARKSLAPIAAAFGDAPRSSARAFAEQYARLNARAIAECGGPLNTRHVAYAFAAAHGCIASVAEISEQASTKSSEAVQATLSGVAPAIVEDRLRACELAVLEHARQVNASAGEYLEARADALASRATPRGAAIALEELETARRAKAAAAPPPPAPRPAPPPASIDEDDEEDEAFARDLAAARRDDGPLPDLYRGAR